MTDRVELKGCPWCDSGSIAELESMLADSEARCDSCIAPDAYRRASERIAELEAENGRLRDALEDIIGMADCYSERQTAVARKALGL